MKKLYFLFIILFFYTNSQIKNNPISLIQDESPFVLSSTDDYYYIIAKGKCLKIEKESGNIKETQNQNIFDTSDYLLFSDNSNNNYLYYQYNYYTINYSTFISFDQMEVSPRPQGSSGFKRVGGIVQDNYFIIYGYISDSNNHLQFVSIPQNNRNSQVNIKVNDNLSCKFIEGEMFICAIIINPDKLHVIFLEYHIYSSDYSQNTLTSELNSNSYVYNNYKSLGLYNTDKNKIKLLCGIRTEIIKCRFFKIAKNLSKSKLRGNLLTFSAPNNLNEKSCYLSIFNSEYLFCCAITNYIKCYRINYDSYNITKEFKISQIGSNSYLTIKRNNYYITLFYMNTNVNNIGNFIYEYYIYLPTCQDASYVILNSLNENRQRENWEKLTNLFTIKTNKYYFEIENPPDELGYFTLNDEKVNGKTLIQDNNYILDFIAENYNKSSSFSKIINYIVSVEDEEAYSKECHINLTFKACYHSCHNCSEDINNSNKTNHNCIKCRNNYYPSPENNNNCYTIEEKKLNWYFDQVKSEFGLCHEDCNSCTGPTEYNCSTENILNLDKLIDSNITVNDFKNHIKDDITSYVNSSKVINGSNFLAVILSSDDMNPEEQLKKGISAFDLGNCTNVLKEYYNISQEENLIILNMETKNDESQKNNNDDKSFNLGKITQLEIYDYSGRKLNLSVCKEDIKIMKYIGNVEGKLDMDSAESLSNQGIDVFNANDDFFNDICHQFDNSDGKDIILTDRRNEIYQDASFCQDGCEYKGINFSLNTANCICDSSTLQEDKEESNINVEKESKDNKFKTLTKSFISNLMDFNFDVLRCYNLALNTKILIHNIGFYCLSFMFILQIIFFFVYLVKKVKPLKNFMLIFKVNNNINNYQNHSKINIRKININSDKGNPPHKNKYSIKITKKENNENKDNKGKNYIKSKFKIKQKNKLNKSKDLLNKNKSSRAENDSYKINLISNNIVSTVNIKNSSINIDNNLKELSNLIQHNNEKFYKIKSNKKDIISSNISDKKEKGKKYFKDISKMETMLGKNNNKFNVNIIKLSKTDSDIQALDYEEAIIFDKRSFLRIYWGFLVDSQIILGTFFTDNNLDLFVIKLSFLVFTFQISFFLNALFYTDEYISDAYHNGGVLDFFSGLPKSIYSFFATLITTNLLRMLSSSKNELMRVIRRNGRFQNYMNIINIKLAKLQKKLIIYFILVFLLESFFLYYVTTFCAVYRYSQKYWFIGCLESFGMDSLVALIICIFLTLFRYISIKKRIKCFYILANIINTFL